MINIELGQPLRAHTVRGGSNHKGDWELIKVQEEKGKKSVSIWVMDAPSGVVEGGTFRVEDIVALTCKSRNVNGKWYDEVNIRGHVSALSNTWESLPTFCDVSGNDDLPF